MNTSPFIAFVLLALAAFANSASAADERRWKTPIPVESHDSGEAGVPQFAFDQNGNGVAVWLLSIGESNQVLASRYTASSKIWTAPVPIDASSGSATSPQVAVDSAGNALIVWSQSSGGIQARRYPVSGPLGAITPLQSVAGSSASPQIAFGTNGTAFAIWHQLSNGSTQVWANRFVTDHWEGAAQVETQTGSSLFPQIAVDAGGNAVAVWSQSADGSHTDIWANRYTVSNHSWNTAAAIETNAGNTFAPQVAVDASGNARAIWFEFDSDTDVPRNRIWSSRYTVSNNSWNAALVESNPGSATAPQVTVDTSGNAVAVWSQVGKRADNSSVSNIWSSRASTGSDVWDAPVLLETDDTGNASSPSVAVDANGNVLAVWSQRTPNAPVFGTYAARYTPGATLSGSWARTRLIGADDRGDAASPRVLFAANGSALAIWSQSNGSRASIVSSPYLTSQWVGAALIEQDDVGRAVTPAIAVDKAGNALAVWAEFSSSPYATAPNSIRWNRYAVSGGWGNAGTFGSNTYATSLPDVAFDSNGNAFVAWEQDLYGGTGTYIMARRYVAGTWNAPFQLSSSWGTSPQLTADTRGNTLVAWPQFFGNGVSKSYSSEGVAGPEFQVPMGNIPQIQFDAQGNGMAVWTWMISGWGVPNWSSTIYAGRYTPTGGWSATQSFQTAVWAVNPRIATDTSGNAIAVWEQGAGWLNPASVFASTYTPSGGWSAPTQMDSTNDAHGAVVAFDRDGNALMLWFEYAGGSPGTTTIRARHFTKGSGWDPGAPAAISVGPQRDYTLNTAGNIQLAFDTDGNALAVWPLLGGGYRYDLWANRYQAGVGWGTTRLIENSDSGSATLPRMVLDANGNALVVWQQSDATRTNIWANRFE